MTLLDRLALKLSAPARALVAASLCLFVSACGRTPGLVNTERPRTGVPYPVTLDASAERSAKSLAAWKSLAGAPAGASVAPPEIDPVTSTLRALPAANGVPLRLPSVGADAAAMSEEEAREALRRFIAETGPLLGVVPAELSLVEHADAAGGTKRALYQQNPFDYPLRGGYGVVEITYAPDRRVVSLSSTAIPDAAQLRRQLAGAKTLKTEEVVAKLVGQTVSFTDQTGRAQTRAVASADEISVREIVVYPVRNEGPRPSLALHLAWEVAVGQSTPVVVYVDAVTGAQLAAAPASFQQARGAPVGPRIFVRKAPPAFST